MMSSAQSLASHVSRACDELSIVGSELRQHLAREIPAKVLMRQARDVVLLSGPTGSGKELIAGACHRSAAQALGRSGDLVRVNCANLTGTLFESELFGYKRGAFTGAERDFHGLVHKASGGTLVLDEFQSLEPANQARLLRLLGEREYRAVGAAEARTTDALIILSTNADLQAMVRAGTFRRDILDRAAAKLSLPSLFERRQDVGELAQRFALEAAMDVGVSADAFLGLTRRARADIETAVVRAQEVSVRRLREIVRDCVFMAAADGLPEALESDLVLPALERELSFTVADRDVQDRAELDDEFHLLVGRAELKDLASRHHVSPRSLAAMLRSVQALIDDMGDQPRTYRNVVERTNRLSKVALWLASGAVSQADFRKFFGKLDHEMPTKSVAHQIYYEVFPKTDEGES